MNNELLMMLTTILPVLIVLILSHRLTNSRDKNSDNKKFIALLNEAIASLNSPENNQKDAYYILEDKFISHHTAYLSILGSANPLTKWRLKQAWNIYFGNNGEQEWWLTNEYSTQLSNKLSNNYENTRSLATARISHLIRLCS